MTKVQRPRFELLGRAAMVIGQNAQHLAESMGAKVWTNVTQCFDNAPEVSWGFCIGGYQPAQKWLKDRKGRALSFDDVKHYQRVLKILSETDRIMQTITMTLTGPGDTPATKA